MPKGFRNTPIANRLLEFVEEDNGSFSATRLGFLLWVIGVLIVWIIDSLRMDSLLPISSDIATIIGILMTGKVVQKFGEKPADEKNDDDPDSPADKKVKSPEADVGLNLDTSQVQISRRPSFEQTPPDMSVQITSDGPDGVVQTITIKQTGVDTAHIDINSSNAGATRNDDAKSVKANPATLTLTCQVDAFLSPADVRVVVRKQTGGNPPVATIAVSHLLLNKTFTYPLRPGDDDRMQSFLQRAAFPAIVAGGA